MSVEPFQNDAHWAPYMQRYRTGEWRTLLFRDLILADVVRMQGPLTFLDVGCGRGFDDDPRIQKTLSERCSHFIGVEPDTQMKLGDWFDELHRSVLEEAPIEPGSVDIGWAVMVLEHLSDPGSFWRKIYQSLRVGGVFWAFTVDRRHLFPWLVRGMDRIGLKDRYLRRLHGVQNHSVYEHYPTRYLSNSPRQIASHVQSFRRCDLINFSRVGQVDGYLPEMARPFAHLLDRLQNAVGLPGVLLAVRCER